MHVSNVHIFQGWTKSMEVRQKSVKFLKRNSQKSILDTWNNKNELFNIGFAYIVD